MRQLVGTTVLVGLTLNVCAADGQPPEATAGEPETASASLVIQPPKPAPATPMPGSPALTRLLSEPSGGDSFPPAFASPTAFADEIFASSAPPEALPPLTLDITPADADCVDCPSRGFVGGSYFVGCSTCGGACVPGQPQCSACTADSRMGRFFCGLYQALVCPDPCYVPQWTPLADAAFFTEAARPKSHTRLRWDSGLNVVFPDRAEYFWAAQGVGRGPSPQAPLFGSPSVNYNDMSMHVEMATGKFAMFVNTTYRSVSPEAGSHGASFGDMDTGTKTLLFDSELLLVTFQMRTFIPVGQPGKGTGTGHVSLEPSVILGINVGPDTYLQAQVAEWIPLGGDPDYAGAILHYHLSMNQVLYRLLPDVPLVGTMEFGGWSFQTGQYTDPVLGPNQRASRDTYLSLGPGLRLFVSDKVDAGLGVAFALQKDHFAETLFRSEFRFRY